MEFLHRGRSDSKRVALFPGTWNPPTVAHVDIAEAAAREADEVVWVLPRAFPHKNFAGAPFEARRAMVEVLARQHPQFSAAISPGGLYVDIARDARDYFAPHTEILFVLGRDAAERIANWDYGTPGVFDNLVRRHRLLVAARQGDYEPAPENRDRIHRLEMAASWDEVSSSEVRRRIASGEEWRNLVHPLVRDVIEDLYLEDASTCRSTREK